MGGGEYFIRGFFAAYNLKDGSLAWKFHVVPPKPGQPLEDAAQEKASKTWGNGDWAKYGGGGSVWDGLVYDPEENLVIAGTGNAEPWPVSPRAARGGAGVAQSSMTPVPSAPQARRKRKKRC